MLSSAEEIIPILDAWQKDGRSLQVKFATNGSETLSSGIIKSVSDAKLIVSVEHRDLECDLVGAAFAFSAPEGLSLEQMASPGLHGLLSISLANGDRLMIVDGGDESNIPVEDRFSM